MPQTIPLALAVAEKAFREFYNQWLCGLKPILSLETASDGQIDVLFKVVAGAGDATGQHEVTPRGGVDEQTRFLAAKASQEHRRRSPSYRRRLIKRAAARTAADNTVMKPTTAVKFVQTEAENLSSISITPPCPDPVVPCMLAVEAVQQPQHYPQYLLQDEVYSYETYAILPATLPQLDGHNDGHVLNHSEINVTEFLDIVKNQENVRRRDAEIARNERDEDLRNIRRMLDLPHR